MKSQWSFSTIITFHTHSHERLEHLISQELKQAAEEEQRDDGAEILLQHNEHFQYDHFPSTIGTHLQQLIAILDDLHSKDTNNIGQIHA